MKEIRYKGELIAIVDGLDHVYLTEWAEDLLRVFVTDPCSDPRCAFVEIHSKMLGECWDFCVPSCFVSFYILRNSFKKA